MRKLGFLRILTLVAAAFGLQTATPAQAAVSVWTFTGTCFDCGPDTAASGVLTLKDYTAGSALTAANYVSFVYSSAVYPSLSFGSITTISGSLNAGASNFAIRRNVPNAINYFGSATNGSWALIQEFPQDIGLGGTWALAPVPDVATWGMMVLGFAGMGAALRRPRRASAFAA